MKRYSLLKKVITAMSAAVLVFSCGMTAFAAETNINTDGEQKDIGVYVKYVDNTVWNTVPTDKNGEGSTTLPDGTEITVSGALKPGWQLVIDPITEKDALDWIGGVLNGKAKDLLPLHIYFIDGSGNIKTAGGVTVTVKQPEKLTDPVAYSLSSEGNASGLTVSMEDGSLTFTTDGSPYYILGEKDSGGTSPNGGTPSTGETSSDPGNSPQTGDTGRMALWVALLLVSVGAVIGTTVVSKKKKYSEN